MFHALRQLALIGPLLYGQHLEAADIDRSHTSYHTDLTGVNEPTVRGFSNEPAVNIKTDIDTIHFQPVGVPPFVNSESPSLSKVRLCGTVIMAWPSVQSVVAAPWGVAHGVWAAASAGAAPGATTTPPHSSNDP